MAVLFPVELLIMWALNKYRPGEEYIPQDVGAAKCRRIIHNNSDLKL